MSIHSERSDLGREKTEYAEAKLQLDELRVSHISRHGVAEYVFSKKLMKKRPARSANSEKPYGILHVSK